jgi:hypothetical protein
LYFALRRDVEFAYAIIEAQRSALEQELDRLTGTDALRIAQKSDQSSVQGPAQRANQGSTMGAAPKEALLFDINILAKDFRIRQIQSTLEWLKNLI